MHEMEEGLCREIQSCVNIHIHDARARTHGLDLQLIKKQVCPRPELCLRL